MPYLFLEIDWHLSSAAFTIGWITSSVMFGAIFGGALAGLLSDKIGRRKVILIAAIIFMIGSILSAFAPNGGQYYLIIVRIGLGLAVGAASALVPSYMSEMAPAHMRGRLSGINQLMICCGMLISYIMDYVLKGLSPDLAWRAMLGCAAIPALILFLGVLALPESPRFLIKSGQIEKAKQVLSFIRKPNEIDGELNRINQTAKQEASAIRNTSWGTLFTGKYRYLVIAGLGVAAFQQFQGANAIFYYIPLIVQKVTGHAATNALMWPIIQGIILVAGAIFFMIIADKFNRRTLIRFGGIVMALSFILPSVINVLIPNANPMMIVVFLCIYVAFYSFTWAPLTWVLVGEIFPLVIRGRAAGLASSFNWIGSFLVGLLFPVMTASMSDSAVFAIFGIVCILGVIFVTFFVPETKGRTLEEIEEKSFKKAS